MFCFFVFLKSRFAPRLDKTSNNEDVTFPAVASQTKLLTLQKINIIGKDLVITMCSSQIYTRILTMCEAADSVVCQMFVSTFHPVFPRSFQFENISSLWARLWWLISAWELTTPSVPQRGEGFFHQCVSRASLLCKYRNTFNPGSNTQKTAATTNNYQLKISLNK